MRKPSNLSETSEQIELAKALNAARPRLLWTSTANGGFRSLKTARTLKAAGVSPGLPDVLVFTKPPVGGSRLFTGAAIELKRVGAPPSATDDLQTAWLEALSATGWAVTVARGCAEALTFLRSLGYAV